MLNNIIRQKKFWLIAIGISAIYLLVFLLLINFGALRSIWLLSESSFWWKANLARKIIFDISIIAIYYNAWLLWPLIIFSGINIALSWQLLLIKWRSRAAGLSTIAFFLGFLGLGCSACGSALLASVIGIGASSALMSRLLWGGQEFLVLSLGILLVSLAFQVRMIKKAEKCKIN